MGILPQEQQFQAFYSRHSSQQKCFKKCSAIENKAMTFLLIIGSICFSVFKSLCFPKWFPVFSQSWPWLEVHLNLSYSKREGGVVYWQHFPPQPTLRQWGRAGPLMRRMSNFLCFLPFQRRRSHLRLEERASPLLCIVLTHSPASTALLLPFPPTL